MTRILVIAGTDSSGGAGLTRDTATATALGIGVMPVVTAVTAQSDGAMQAALPMSPDLVSAQIRAALCTATPAAIKIGMLGAPEIATAVARALADCQAPVVLDPVLKSTSGGTLFTGQIPAPLLARATLLTPNIDEAAALLGQPPADAAMQMAAQARALSQSAGDCAVLLKGGHAKGAHSTDVLWQAGRHMTLSAPRAARGKRGTGCTLATAIACQLAQGHSLPDACRRAKHHVTHWLSG